MYREGVNLMSFSDRMKEVFDQGLIVSKDLLSKAGVKAQDLGEKGVKASKEMASKAGAKVQEMGEIGVLRFEIKQLENQAQKQIGRLGVEAYKAFADRGAKSITVDTPAIKVILAEIASIEQLIEQKEDQIKQKSNKADSASSED
jgi:capsule polysaccharide export protein KpsE/RkpR